MSVFGLIETGGTIGGQSGKGGVELAGSLPLPGSERQRFITRQPVQIFSEDAEPEDWIRIASAVRELACEDVDGCLILHGTDTMAYTASFLSFALQDLPFPIVLTGSAIPGHDPGSDAGKNIEDAILALKELPAGVYVSFSDGEVTPSLVHHGARVRKTRAFGSAPFSSPASQPLAMIENGAFRKLLDPPLPRGLVLPVGWEPVFWLRLYPGVRIPEEEIRERLILIELYPSSTAPGRLREFIRNNPGREFFLVTPDGRPVRHDYPSGVFLGQAEGLAMTPEAAYTKIGWASAIGDIGLVGEEICGEFLS